MQSDRYVASKDDIKVDCLLSKEKQIACSKREMKGQQNDGKVKRALAENSAEAYLSVAAVYSCARTLSWQKSVKRMAVITHKEGIWSGQFDLYYTAWGDGSDCVGRPFINYKYTYVSDGMIIEMSYIY